MTKYFVVWKLNNNTVGINKQGWHSFHSRKKAGIFYNALKGRTRYRCLSYGLGCILQVAGRP